MTLPTCWAEVTVDAYTRAMRVQRATELGYGPRERLLLLGEALAGRRGVTDLDRLKFMAEPLEAPPVSSFCRVDGRWLAGIDPKADYRVPRPVVAADEAIGKFVLLEDLKLTAEKALAGLQRGERLPELLAVVAEAGPWMDRAGLRARLTERRELFAALPIGLALGVCAHFFSAYESIQKYKRLLGSQGEPEEKALAREYGLHWVVEGYRARKGLTEEQAMGTPAGKFYADLDLFAAEASAVREMRDRLMRSKA